MRSKCPGSGHKVDDTHTGMCPVCNVPFRLSKHGRLRAHSQDSLAQEAFRNRKYRIHPRTGERVAPLHATIKKGD